VRTVTRDHSEVLTPDLGHTGTTQSVTDAIVAEVERRRRETVND
jgi:isocitrate/isopropylmalate dehydrogenase